MQHTPDQAAIIAASRGNILVSAAAGSGKTAVLTDRIVSRITSRELDISRVLVMTFTEAAARNMKNKIEKKLRDALASADDRIQRRWLSQQLSLLPGASVSTIHAFCLDVIRNFYTCARDDRGQPLVQPGFAVDDGIECDLLLNRTLDEWMSAQYEAIDAAEIGEGVSDFDDARKTAFYRLIDGYGSAAGDQPVRDLILKMYRFLRSLPDYDQKVGQWLTDIQQAASEFSSSPHLKALLRLLRLLLDRALAQSDEMADLLAGDVRFIAQADRNQAYHAQMKEMLTVLQNLNRYLEAGGQDWNQIRQFAAGLSGLELPRASKYDSPEKTAFLEIFTRHMAEVIYCLTGRFGTERFKKHFIFKTRHLFCLTAEEIEADISAMLPAISELFRLVAGLDREYARAKQAANLIDFSDFEHLALKILRTDEAREYYRQRCTEVYVDEYQDTSGIQEEIISAVSQANCLAVGDIKQSIYKFRHAQPRIFLQRASLYREGSGGSLHELNCNFRSVAGILTAVNDIFSQIMSRGAGEIDYDERHALTLYREDAPDLPRPAVLLLVNIQPAQPGKESADDGDQTTAEDEMPENEPAEEADSLAGAELSRIEQEALAAAARIHQLHDSGNSWRDFAVLGRTRAMVRACQSQLEKAGIPVVSDSGGSFLETPVMRQIEALIHLLDNARQDIPLAAVLRAELFQGGFTAEELAVIRLHSRQVKIASRFFFDAVQAYRADGPDAPLRQRLNDFFAWITYLREQEQVLSIGELIGLIFDQSGWLERLAAHPDGVGADEVRQLRQFRQWAEQFESRRPRGLHAFAGYMSSLRERGSVESPFNAADSDDDAVRIMTIHRSKGLEFPVVFLIGTRYDLTPKESRDCLLVSENLGLGMDFADPERQIRYPTHLKLAMIEEMKAASLAEELRLLYVAMTRAMDQFFMISSVRAGEGQAENRLSALADQARASVSRQLPDYLVLSARSYLEWLILALARDSRLDLNWLADGDFPASPADTTSWRIEFQQQIQIQRQITAAFAGRMRVQPTGRADADPSWLIRTILSQTETLDENMVNNATMRIAAPYRYADAAGIPVKLTVSELKRREQSLRDEDEASPRGIGLELHVWEDSPPEADQPDPLLSSSELGTLLHAFFRYMDLPALLAKPNCEEAERQLAAMASAEIFNANETAQLQPFCQLYAAFARSPLAAEMVRAQQEGGLFQAEMPFTLALPACSVHRDCAGLAPDDQVYVQGIIDCWYDLGDGVTLIDYKSDRLPDEPLLCQAELEQRYGLQLDFYARAIQAATGRQVRRRLIWLIRQGREYELAARGTGLQESI